jgi:pimeloyl-ACP methyl ester carboxylesterase
VVASSTKCWCSIKTGEFPICRYAGAGGLLLAAEVGGEATAPPILLLHGGGQTRHSWGGAMRRLVSLGYHVINLDARGHGESAWAPDGRYGLQLLAQDIKCVIDTLPSKPALVGASMGGAASLYLVGNSQEPVAGALVLVDVVPSINLAGAAKIQAFMRAHENGFSSLENAAEAIREYNPRRPRPKDNSGLLKNLRLKPDGRFYWHWDPRVMSAGTDVEPPLWSEQLMAAANQVHIPTLLIRGLESDVVTDAGVADLQRRIPTLEIFNVPNAGHMVAGDKNDAFNQGLFDFLQRQFPSA